MLGWEFPPFVTGGLGIACQGLCEGLAALDVEVLFVVPRSRGRALRHGARVLGCNELAREPEPVLACTGRVAVLGIESALEPYQRPREYERGARARFTGAYGNGLFEEVERYADVVTELVGSEPFDVVHAHDWMTFAAARRVRERTGRPLVCHVHACERDRSGDAGDERIRAAEAAGLRAAARVVCVSRFTARRVREDYGVPAEKLRVVHNAVRPAERCERAPRRDTRARCTVLFLGRVTAQKGPRYFLEAAREVVAADPAVRFVLGGTGDLLPEMVEYAAALGLGRHVRFTGRLSQEEVEEVYADADLFVLSSVSEPFGLTPLEALSRAVPVIVSRQSGVAEVLASCPKYDYWDTAGLASQVLTLARDPSLRRQLAEAGRLEIDGMRWERRAQALLDVYRELCA